MVTNTKSSKAKNILENVQFGVFGGEQCFFPLSVDFWSALGVLMCSFLEHFFNKNSPKISRALRAPCFEGNFSGKHPSAAFGPTIRKTKNFSSCFSLLFLLVAARSAPKFSFFLWNFSSGTVSERR